MQPSWPAIVICDLWKDKRVMILSTPITLLEGIGWQEAVIIGVVFSTMFMPGGIALLVIGIVMKHRALRGLGIALLVIPVALALLAMVAGALVCN